MSASLRRGVGHALIISACLAMAACSSTPKENEALSERLALQEKVETQVKDALLHKTSAFRSLLDSLTHTQALRMSVSERETTATHMVVMLTWWLSFEYVLDPRHALEDESSAESLRRGARHVLGLMSPYAVDEHKSHLESLLAAY